MIALLSVLPPILASEITANDLVIRGSSPNAVDKLAIVGPATELCPNSERNTRAIVPLPPRFGPISKSIF